jgi:hypothetical protein
MQKYFWKPATGLKADVERHRREEARLVALVEGLEAEPELTEFQDRYLKTLCSILCHMQQSKADVVSKIGTKKAMYRNVYGT